MVFDKKFLIKSITIVYGAFLFAHFFADFIDKVSIFHNYDLYKVNRLLKLLIVSFSALMTPFLFKYIPKLYRTLATIFVILSLGFVFKNNFSEDHLITFVRYMFPLVVFPLFYFLYVYDETDKYFKIVINFFKVSVVINFLAIISSLIFDIQEFRTYNNYRFGYNGLILSQGHAPYYYLSALFVFYKKKEMLFVFLTIILSILGGMKALYLGIFVFFMLILLLDRENSNFFRKQIIIFLMIITFASLIFLFKNVVFLDVYKKDGFFTAVSSYRDVNFLNIVGEINSENFSYIFGSINLSIHRVEMEMIDIFLFFGLSGLLVVIYFLDIWIRRYRSNIIFISGLLTIVMVSFLSGNVIYIPMSGYLLISVFLLILRGKGIKNYN